MYFVFRNIRENRDQFTPQFSFIGIALLIGAQVILFIAKIIQVNFVEHILFVCSLLAIIWAAYSYRITERFLFPCILLSLAFPVWGDAAIPLQHVTIFTTNLILKLSWLPYHHEGAYFFFPNGIFEVAPECSGLQQLLVSLIIGLLFSEQNQLRIRDTIRTLIFISLTSIIINTVRIFVIMLIGYYTKMESSLVEKHLLLGWIIYGVGIFVFLYLYSKVNFKTATKRMFSKAYSQASRLTYKTQAGLLSLVLVLVCMPVMLTHILTAVINHQELSPVKYSVASDSWVEKPDLQTIPWLPDFPRGDMTVKTAYTNADTTIYLNINKFARLNDNIEPINMDNHPYNHEVWRVQDTNKIEVPTSRGNNDSLRIYNLISDGFGRLTVLSFYLVNGKIVDSQISAKLAVLLGLMRLNYDIKIVCLAVKPKPDTGSGYDLLVKFYRDLAIN